MKQGHITLFLMYMIVILPWPIESQGVDNKKKDRENIVAYPWKKQRDDIDFEFLKKKAAVFCQELLERPQLIREAQFLQQLQDVYPEYQYYMGPIRDNPKKYSLETKRMATCAENSIKQACLFIYWLLSGQYQRFASMQKEGIGLKESSFHELKNVLYASLHKDRNYLDALFTRIILTHLARIPDYCAYIRSIVSEGKGASDRTLQLAFEQCSQSLPSFKRQSFRVRSAIALESSSQYEYACFLSTQSTLSDLILIEKYAKNDALSFKLYITKSVLQALAEAQYFFYPWTEGVSDNMYQVTMKGMSALGKMIESNWHAWDAYACYLEAMSIHLGMKENNLSIDMPVRIMCLLGIVCQEDVHRVRFFWDQLSEGQRACLSAELSVNSLKEDNLIQIIGLKKMYRNAFTLKKGARFPMALELSQKLYEQMRNAMEQKETKSAYLVHGEAFFTLSSDPYRLLALNPVLEKKEGRMFITSSNPDLLIRSQQIVSNEP